MITPEFVEEHGLTSSQYIASISDKYREKWDKKLDQVSFNDEQLEFLHQDLLPIKAAIFSAEWCPDCQNAVPIVIKMAEETEGLDLVIIDRDEHVDELKDYQINGGLRVPFVLFTNNKYQELTRWVERSQLAYELIYKAKMRALDENTDDYGQFVRQSFHERSKDLFKANLESIFEQFRKAMYIRNSAAKLEEFGQQLTA